MIWAPKSISGPLDGPMCGDGGFIVRGTVIVWSGRRVDGDGDAMFAVTQR